MERSWSSYSALPLEPRRERSLALDSDANTQYEILNQTLCSTCNEVISVTNSRTVTKRNVPDTSLSLLEESVRRGCPLCPLLVSAFSTYEKEQIRFWDSELRSSVYSEYRRIKFYWKDQYKSSLDLVYNPGPPNSTIEKRFVVIEASRIRGRKRTFSVSLCKS
jgi:hypothetical protein